MLKCVECVMHVLILVDEIIPPRKKKQRNILRETTPPTQSLRVSIGRITSQNSQQPNKPFRVRKKSGGKISNLYTTSAQSSPRLLPADPLTVQFSRSRLKGYFGLPYSGAVPDQRGKMLLPEHVLPRNEELAVGFGDARWIKRDEVEFSLAPGATEHVDNEAKKGRLTLFPIG